MSIFSEEQFFGKALSLCTGRVHKIFALPISIAFLICSTPSILAFDDVGVYGSIKVASKADAAAEAFRIRNFIEARRHCRDLIGMAPEHDEFYFGFYQASRSLKDWREAGLALEQLFQHNAKFKNELALEYGEVLFNLNRYSEAEPYLKKALATIDTPSIVDKYVARLIRKGDIVHKPVVNEPAEVKYVVIEQPAPRPEIDETKINPLTSDTGLKIKWAYLQSESIVVAEYRGFERDEIMSYYSPPTAIYKITKILKGHRMNPTLPVRYEFHDKTNKDKPKDWKFDEATMMPKVGSKWIIFIPNSVPVDGKFETYHGSFGRMPYKDIDKVLRILGQHTGQTHP